MHAVGTPAAPLASESPVPAASTAPTSGALKGTTLQVVVGTFDVPASDDRLDDLGKKLAAETGMAVKVERQGKLQLPAKIEAIVESGSGADLFVCADTDVYLNGEKLLDVSAVANDIATAWHGWYDIAKRACVVNGVWRGLMLGQAPVAWNWRPDLFRAAGWDKFPDAYDELLDAAVALKSSGKPIGMSLGHARDDSRAANYSVLWAFGGAEFSDDGTKVTIDSPETRQAIDWYVRAFQQMPTTVLSWLDPDNDQTFLAGKISATPNASTLYLSGRDSSNADQQSRAGKLDVATWPEGPAGRFCCFNTYHWAALASTRNAAGVFAWLSAWFDKKFLIPWTKLGQSTIVPALADVDAEEVWPDDPKLKAFREVHKLNRMPGWAGPPTHAVARSVTKFTLADMFAQAVTGKMTVDQAVAWAAEQYQSLIARGP
jgi:multiple sugar transport system substrate-binding protein